MKNLKKVFAVSGLLIILGSLTACNTVEGAGQDIQAGGKAISGAASDVQH